LPAPPSCGVRAPSPKRGDGSAVQTVGGEAARSKAQRGGRVGQRGRRSRNSGRPSVARGRALGAHRSTGWYNAYVQRMTDASESRHAGWNAPTTTKERNAVQRSVTKLLDALAPERAISRSAPAPVQIEPYRTPSGCVLQAPTAALSVSWFPGAASSSDLGELHVVLWRGGVTRRGSGVPRESASVIREWTLRPVELSSDATRWREDGDGVSYDIQGLADHCLALLNAQVFADDPTGSATPTTPRRRD